MKCDEYDHPVIWLQAWCDSCERHVYEGRQWCQDNVWDKCDGEGCKQMPVKYIIAPDQPNVEPIDEA